MERFAVRWGSVLVFSLFSQVLWADQPTPNSTPNFLNDHSFDNDDVDGTTLPGKATPDRGELGSRATPVDLQVKTTSDEIGAPVQSTQAQQAVTELSDSSSDPLGSTLNKSDGLTPGPVGEPIENEQQKKALQSLDQSQIQQQGPVLTPTPPSDGL